MKRPWLVMGNSHEHEWNGRIGRRFVYEEKAREYARRIEDDGAYNVKVYYSPIGQEGAGR
jgi:hypothetical protein